MLLGVQNGCRFQCRPAAAPPDAARQASAGAVNRPGSRHEPRRPELRRRCSSEGPSASATRDVQALDGLTFSRRGRASSAVRRAERRRQDDRDAVALGLLPGRRREVLWRGRPIDDGRPRAPDGLHAGGARALPEDARRRGREYVAELHGLERAEHRARTGHWLAPARRRRAPRVRARSLAREPAARPARGGARPRAGQLLAASTSSSRGRRSRDRRRAIAPARRSACCRRR